MITPRGEGRPRRTARTGLLQHKREDIRAHAIDNHLYLISTALQIQVCLTGFDLYLLRGVVDGYRDSRRDRQAVDHNFDQTGEALSRYGQLLSVNRSSRDGRRVRSGLDHRVAEASQ